MQIILKQKDIEQALALYLRDQGINLTNKNLSVSWTAGRKESGITAEIDIEEIPGSSKSGPLPVMNRRDVHPEPGPVLTTTPVNTEASTDDEPVSSFQADDEPALEAEQAIQTAKVSGSRVSLFS